MNQPQDIATNGTDVWIVDNASDKVYQFKNARGVTSGSLNASLLFSLASTNTNPQGIADPPLKHSTKSLSSIHPKELTYDRKNLKNL